MFLKRYEIDICLGRLIRKLEKLRLPILGMADVYHYRFSDMRIAREHYEHLYVSRFDNYNGLNICVPPESYVEILTPQCDHIRKWVI